MHFGRAVAPGGFAWVVPFSRDGVAVRARRPDVRRATPAARFRAFADAIRAALRHRRSAWPEPRLKILPLGPVAERTWTDRLLAVGDAAGLVKPTTGGGIYYGLITGQFAADVLGEALPTIG